MILTFHKNKLKEIFKFIWFIIKLDASFNLCLFKQEPSETIRNIKTNFVYLQELRVEINILFAPT